MDSVVNLSTLAEESSEVQTGTAEFWLEAEDYYYALDYAGRLISSQEKVSGSSYSRNLLLSPEQQGCNIMMLNQHTPRFQEGDHSWFTIKDQVFSTDLYHHLSKWSVQGEKLWQCDLPSVITAMDVIEQTTVLGFMDGRVLILDNQGKVQQSYQPGGSRIEILYGVSISDDGTYIALVSGLYPQRFVVLEHKNDDFRPIYHSNLNSQFRRPITMGYTREGAVFFYETSQGVALFNPISRELQTLPVNGELVNLLFPVNLEIPLILSRKGQNYTLQAFLKGRLFFQREIEADFSRMDQVGESLYWSVDNRVLLLEWSQQ